MGPYCCWGGGGGGEGALAHGGEGGGGGGGGSSPLLPSSASAPPRRRRWWGMLLLLGLCCSGLYVLLYYRMTLTTPSLLLFPRLADGLRSLTSSSSSTPPPPPPSSSSSSSLSLSSNDTHASLKKNTSHQEPSSSSSSSFSDAIVTFKPLPANIENRHWNAPAWQSPERLSRAIGNGTAQPVLTLFTTWSDRADLSLVRNLTLRNWAQLRPWVRPVLLTNTTALAEQARAMGWDSIPVSRTAIGVPVLKYMYLDIMARFNSTLFAFANGDILFTRSLVESLLVILTDPSLPLDQRSPFVVGQRTNVAKVTDQETLTFQGIEAVAKKRGKKFTTMAEDFFITDRRFDWDNVPGVVIGRVAYDNWLVLNAIQKKNVVVDVSSTVLAMHQTTKAGNHEGFSHRNSSYNDRMLTKLYKHVHYMGGCTDCAPWRTLLKDGRHYVEKRPKKAKHC